MKKLSCFCLMILLLLNLVACGGSKAETSAEDSPTWQEQYDLGMKYLSDGNYEEAIIAFTAAIEIDPKLPEAYIGLAEIYVAQGDLEKAAAILDEAFAAVGENETLTAARERLLGSASNVPVLPAILTDKESTGTCTYQAENYVEATPELEAAFAPIIAAGLANDEEQVRAMITSEALRDAAAAVAVSANEDGSYYGFWTKQEDAVFYYTWYHGEDGDTVITLEYREEAGTGFFCSDRNHVSLGDYLWWYAHGETGNYLWNGSFTKHSGGSQTERVYHGSARDDLIHGEYNATIKDEYYSGEYQTYERFEQFEYGEPATTKRVENGEADYYVAYEGEQRPPECVTHSW